MSYCAIMFFNNDIPNDEIEFKNSWGGLSRIWNSLYGVYIKDPDIQFDSWLSNKDGFNKLFELSERKDIPHFIRAVLLATCDYAIVENKNFKRFAEDLRKFSDRFLTKGACHLLAWANVIENSNAQAIGFYGTSVGENLWIKYDENQDKCVPYNLTEKEDHFEIYYHLEEIDNKDK